jgi:hypothetical protein
MLHQTSLNKKPGSPECLRSQRGALRPSLRGHDFGVAMHYNPLYMGKLRYRKESLSP